MAIDNNIQMYADKEKTQKIYPRTKADNVLMSDGKKVEDKISEIGSDLETNNNQIEKEKQKNKLKIRQLSKQKLYRYIPPIDFPWVEIPIKIYTDGFSFMSLNDVSEFKNISSKTIYVDIINGNNASDGLTESTARKTLESAMNLLNDGDTIMIINESGTVIHPSLGGFNGKKFTKSCNLISKNKVKIVGASHGYTYTLENGIYKYTGSAGLANALRVVDLYFEEPIEYTKVASLTECQTTKGTYFVNNTELYINTINGQIHVDKILPIAGFDLLVNDNSTQNVKLYVENIDFIGGASGCVSITNTATYTEPEFYAKNCKFSFNKSSRGAVNIQGAKLTILQNCIVDNANGDGFGYSMYNGIKPKSIEINCTGSNCGINGAMGNGADNTYNGSTIHEGCTIIRINGKYFNNTGINVADTGTTTNNFYSLNLNCMAFDSNSSYQVSYNAGFMNLDNGKMWLDTCIGFGSTYDVAGTNVYTHNCVFDKSDTTIEY